MTLHIYVNAREELAWTSEEEMREYYVNEIYSSAEEDEESAIVCRLGDGFSFEDLCSAILNEDADSMNSVRCSAKDAKEEFIEECFQNWVADEIAEVDCEVDAKELLQKCLDKG